MPSDKPTFLLLRARIPALAASCFLGRFVTHPSRPLDNSAPKDPSVYIGEQVVEIEEELTVDVVGSDNNSNVKLALQNLANFQAGIEGENSTIIASKYIKTYRLLDHYKVFDQIEAVAPVREELDGPKGLMTRSKGKLYMVIGFKAFSAGTVSQEVIKQKTGIGAKITIPLSNIAAGLQLNIADPEIEGRISHHSQHLHRYTSKDEQVFAVEYKVVTQRNIWGIYSAKAPMTVAHNPTTHNWDNAVFDSDKLVNGEFGGRFDDDSEVEESSEEKTVNSQNEEESRLQISDEPLTEKDTPGDEFLLLE